ncbi:STAS domain-containing protein [Streptacidiphilus sp. ASG 303]|uniref:STAS domain-containing protein n=1 Tax=Streptacidiphilus sp. ASG 303 TaxID=2896847 RepID=UPI001E3932E5|nr:STAS domain-containing protein [Streptacidiphilus sp. ASG 303]MCD0483851.1 STAS domain-containing protein [Streptacidiphilus sp. ASG 303]
MTVEVSVPDPDVAVVAITGELDVDTATELHFQLANQLHHGRRHLVLDLADVPFMDSSGLNIVIRAQQETRRAEGSLRLARPTPAVRRIIDLTGVSITTPVHDGLDEALAEHRREVHGRE